MNLLVTGANGQLGNELRCISDCYAAHQFYFTDVDDLDITCRDAVHDFVETNRIDIVINCAAYTAVDKAESEVEAANVLNAEAVGYLASACCQTGAMLVHISTDYVYDGCTCRPYKEDHPTNPLSEYGRSKLAGEKLAYRAPKSVIIRTSWLYSPYGNNFVKTMLRLGKERDVLNVVFDQTGTPTYAADLAKSMMQIISQPLNGIHHRLYHYSNEGVCSWYDFACEIMLQAGLKCAVRPIETKDYSLPAPRPHYSVLNKARIKADYGLEIPHWKASLSRCLAALAD